RADAAMSGWMAGTSASVAFRIRTGSSDASVIVRCKTMSGVVPGMRKAPASVAQCSDEADFVRGTVAHGLAIESPKARAFVQGDGGCIGCDDVEHQCGGAGGLGPRSDAGDQLCTNSLTSRGWRNPHAHQLAHVNVLVSRASNHAHVAIVDNRDERRKLDELRLPASNVPLRSLGIGRAECVWSILQRVHSDGPPPLAVSRSQSLDPHRHRPPNYAVGAADAASYTTSI